MERNFIKAKAAERGEPLGQVAKTIGVAQSTLSSIIAGAGVSPEMAKKIAAWHGDVTAGFVLWGADEDY